MKRIKLSKKEFKDYSDHIRNHIRFHKVQGMKIDRKCWLPSFTGKFYIDLKTKELVELEYNTQTCEWE